MADWNQSTGDLPPTHVSRAMRIGAIVLRAVFICTLIALTICVSLPQNETLWTAYDTPADLIRLLLGVLVCLWLAFQLFYGPRDAQGYRTWFYLGLAAVPFGILCLFAVW